jgi:predicted metal-dependent hydrolase
MKASDIRTIDFGGEAINFLIKRTSRRKTVAISVGYDGVRVLAPVDVADDHIFGIVRKKGPWVLGKQAGYRELGSVAGAREFVSGETVHYLGRAYRLKVVPDNTTVVTRIVARGSHLIAPVPAGADGMIRRSAVRSGLCLWYRERAKAHFPVRAKAIASLLGVKTPTVHIVDQSKRWGSCDARGRIRLNWRLVMAPMSLMDYVIAHEVCHVLEHNHSRRFWRSLEIIMPDYETRLRKLDRLGHLFFW